MINYFFFVIQILFISVNKSDIRLQAHAEKVMGHLTHKATHPERYKSTKQHDSAPCRYFQAVQLSAGEVEPT